MFGFVSVFAVKSSIPFLSSNSQTTPLGVSAASGMAALWCYRSSLKHSTVDREIVREKKLSGIERRFYRGH